MTRIEPIPPCGGVRHTCNVRDGDSTLGEVASILLVIAAISGYVNHRFLKLPSTSGTLAVALVSSLIAVAADHLFPALQLQRGVAAFLGQIDFNETLMHGMLSFLLFAGALHIDLEGLLNNKWTIGALATVGVLLSTAVIGILTWWTFLCWGSTFRCSSALCSVP